VEKPHPLQISSHAQIFNLLTSTWQNKYKHGQILNIVSKSNLPSAEGNQQQLASDI